MQNSIFNVLGPVMIGPSSSHTAGAQRLGYAAYMLSDKSIKSITFYLHGSFAKTCKGHGTDKALVGGALGMKSWDNNIRKSLKIADQSGLIYKFEERDLGDVHPNTVAMNIIKCNDEQMYLQGSSIGGGGIIITAINEMQCSLTGEYPTVVIKHKDKVGMLNNITKLFKDKKINIVSIKNNRNSRGETAFTIIETDEKLQKKIKKDILAVNDIYTAEIMNKL